MTYRALPLALVLLGSAALAQVNPQDHAAHHPDAAASVPSASAPAARPLAAAPGSYEQQMQKMQDMHQRMQAARTPAEKQALMGEHLKLMQSGMEMMSQMGTGMGGGGMGAMGGMGGSGMGGPGAGAPALPGPGASAPAAGPQGMQGMGGMMGMHGAMERRMAMMEQMMQMMVDRESAMPRR